MFGTINLNVTCFIKWAIHYDYPHAPQLHAAFTVPKVSSEVESTKDSIQSTLPILKMYLVDPLGFHIINFIKPTAALSS